ncbi:hypothetical protein [Rhizobium leguminosarum]|uniref:hypothetical protein n=1 Tax=Rhizobium leguminosarum TaxID=384 RepID=UPI001C974F92|nr:hypothetical protein [Rhizobium leguminosarum]
MFDTSVDKSIVAVAKAEEKTNSTTNIKKTIKTAAGTETMEVTVTPAEAKNARKRVREKPKYVKSGLTALEGTDYRETIATRCLRLQTTIWTPLFGPLWSFILLPAA